MSEDATSEKDFQEFTEKLESFDSLPEQEDIENFKKVVDTEDIKEEEPLTEVKEDEFSNLKEEITAKFLAGKDEEANQLREKYKARMAEMEQQQEKERLSKIKEEIKKTLGEYENAVHSTNVEDAQENNDVLIKLMLERKKLEPETEEDDNFDFFEEVEQEKVEMDRRERHQKVINFVEESSTANNPDSIPMISVAASQLPKKGNLLLGNFLNGNGLESKMGKITEEEGIENLRKRTEWVKTLTDFTKYSEKFLNVEPKEEKPEYRKTIDLIEDLGFSSVEVNELKEKGYIDGPHLALTWELGEEAGKLQGDLVREIEKTGLNLKDINKEIFWSKIIEINRKVANRQLQNIEMEIDFMVREVVEASNN